MRLTPPLLAYVLAIITAAAQPATFTAGDQVLQVLPGTVKVPSGTLNITHGASLLVPPVAERVVRDEPLRLSADKPAGFSKGTKLRGCNARDVNASGSLFPATLEIRRTPGGERLKLGEDYLLEPEWAGVGVGPSGRVTPQDLVYASYRVSLLRLDTVQLSPAGTVTLKLGEPHISAPLPPTADAGHTAIAYLLRPYQATRVAQEDLFPILETGPQAVTGTTRGRIPKTLAKLRAGASVTIVCLGDSVTAGGNASKPEFRYVDVFAAGLRERFPKAQLNVQNISAGGSSSGQWLYPSERPYRGLRGDANPARFERVLEAKPDLLTIEFVNDAGLNAERLRAFYGDLLQRLEPLGTEVIFITPHFTMWKMMGFRHMREVERRPYVLELRKFTAERNLALADAAARWEHLWREGLPYLTLLDNTINHPDDRGHRLFAEELWKCFE